MEQLTIYPIADAPRDGSFILLVYTSLTEKGELMDMGTARWRRDAWATGGQAIFDCHVLGWCPLPRVTMAPQKSEDLTPDMFATNH
jgi:hypothetical protein